MVKDFDWAHFKRVLDIGGANGTVVAALLKQYPNMEGVVFDQPQARMRSHSLAACVPVGKECNKQAAICIKPRVLDIIGLVRKLQPSKDNPRTPVKLQFWSRQSLDLVTLTAWRY